MDDTMTTRVFCPHCGSEMCSDYDVVNKVRVFVCTKPTCLYRIYPDYPRRAGNQEICYNCGKIFIAGPDSAGVLCPRCKSAMQKKKSKPQGRPRAGTKVRIIQERLTA